MRNGGGSEGRGGRFRLLLSKHLVWASIFFALIYQLIDIILNYFVSGELRQGFLAFYKSSGGKEDLLRFFITLGLLIGFGVFFKKIILELKCVEEEKERRLNEIKSFAASIVHDVKNPAIGIYTYAKLLRKHYRRDLDEEGKRRLKIMEETAKNIVELVENINTFIKAREFPLTFESVNVKGVLEIIHDGIISTLEVRNIEWFEPEKIPMIKADRLSVHRIFRNLTDNALKYGGDGLSRIIIEYFSNGSFHVFSVSDNGCGIDKSDQKKVFETFTRAESSRSVDGSGLGLAIVKELVEKHGGKISINSVTGKGASFIFSISKNL